MSNAGISRSGRVRKKSAKLMEMDDDGVPIMNSPHAIPANFGKHNQNLSKNRKMAKMSDDSEPEKFQETRKLAPVKTPKAGNTNMSLPVKKRHPNMSMGVISNLPPVAAAVAATANPMKMNKMPFSNSGPGTRAKPQVMNNNRIGIVPTGSDSSSSSSSSSTSSSSSDSSDSNSDSDSDIGMPKMNTIQTAPATVAKGKPRAAASTPKPVMVKKEKIIPQQTMMNVNMNMNMTMNMNNMNMSKVKPSSFFSPNAVGPLGLDDSDETSDDSDDDDSTSESNSDEEENKLKIVEEPPAKKPKKIPAPKVKKEPVSPMKKVVTSTPIKKGKSPNSAVNAAAAVLANLGNPAAFDDGSSNSNFDGLISPKLIKEEKIERVPKKSSASSRDKKKAKGKPGRQKKMREGPPRKPPRPMTAYMLWCQNNRKKIVSQCPKMADFSMISKKMGQVWQSLQDKEKMAWKRKAKKLANKRLTFISTGKTSDPNLKILSQHILGGTGAVLNRPGEDSFGSNKLLATNTLNSHLLTTSPGTIGSGGAAETVRPVGTAPIDVAAHLKLLGESLSIIGQRLTEHEGQIAVSGSLSVLLDSTLCALAPLMCLTAQVNNLDGCAKDVLGSVLDNVAYIMPGL